MRYVVIGAVEFTRCSLEALLGVGANVVAVFNPEQSDVRNSDYADLEPVATAKGIPLHRFRKIGDPETIELLKSLKPDVLFVLGLSQLLPPQLLCIPSIASIGSHPALLPRNRGRHPLVWTLIEGLEEGGLTFFVLDEGADSGDIVWQRAFTITDEDTAGTLYERICSLASEALPQIVSELEEGRLRRIPQDHAMATYWRKRDSAEGEIIWSQDARAVFNLIRALTKPYPGAYTYFYGQRVTVWLATLLENRGGGSPGEIVEIRERSLIVACGTGAVALEEWEAQPDTKFAKGLRFTTEHVQ